MNEKKEEQHFKKLAKPAQRALANAGITTLQQLTQWTEQDLMLLHGIGKNAFKTLSEIMEDDGLFFSTIER